MELIQCTHWLQGISERGVSYKATHDPYSKMLIESSIELKKFRIRLAFPSYQSLPDSYLHEYNNLHQL